MKGLDSHDYWMPRWKRRYSGIPGGFLEEVAQSWALENRVGLSKWKGRSRGRRQGGNTYMDAPENTEWGGNFSHQRPSEGLT